MIAHKKTSMYKTAPVCTYKIYVYLKNLLIELTIKQNKIVLLGKCLKVVDVNVAICIGCECNCL